MLGSPGDFFLFVSPTSIFNRFFIAFERPRALPDPKKPLKSLYRRQISKVHQIGKSNFLTPLWGALGQLLGSFAVPWVPLGRSWAALGDAKGAKCFKKVLKKDDTYRNVWELNESCIKKAPI